jgi:membrane-bound ClpP family serine protease
VVAETLAIPELGFALIALGLVATAAWGAHPTLRWVGASGVLVLCCGLVGLAIMPPSPAALFLLALTVANLAMEVLCLPGFALHAIGGALGLALAGLCLSEPWSGAHPSVVLPGAALVGVGTWWAARQSWRARRTDPLDTSDRLLGRDLVVLDVGDGNLGHAVVAGHMWMIHDPINPLVAGGAARVTGRTEDLLTVCQRRTETGITS